MYLLQNYEDIYLVCLQIVSTYHLHYYYHDIMYQRQASDTLFSTIIFNSICWSEGRAKCCRTHPVSPRLIILITQINDFPDQSANMELKKDVIRSSGPMAGPGFLINYNFIITISGEERGHGGNKVSGCIPCNLNLNARIEFTI